ncbi:condensation domain-containing protein [Phytohabitans rumicis]|uniref:Condensation domain-containing protein n=1 Tax=Phytohabitans rumicis TaxID=1076125 RepID=A0A6V8L2N0_9ACTN|nr:condensation domain-containing protein [Phytohabitans rumicis]GFJ86965.1 hypothetical protein Prum_006070 [Phytohabitans rumicis]
MAVPLTWGQRALWTAIQRRGAEQALMSMRRVVAVPRGAPADVDSVARAIGVLIGRHSSLRTRIQTLDGQPYQVVVDSGELPLLSREAGEPDGGAAVAHAVAEELAAAPFDHAGEWPQRVALVRDGDRVRQVALAFSHTTVDFRAVEILLRELRLLLLRGHVRTPAPLQSVDIARLEQGPDRARSERAVAHWVSGYDQLPTDTLPPVGPPLTPRFQRVVLVSEAADTAIRLAATRHRVTSTTVLLAAVAVVISVWSGTDVCGMHSMVHNRALDGYRDAIAKLNQVGLVVVDTRDRPSFAELLSRVFRAAVRGYRHAHYDPAQLRAAFQAAGHPYENGVSPHCFFNDIRLSTDADLFGHATDEADVRAAMRRSTVAVAEGFERFTWRLRVQVLDAPRGVGIAVTGDTAYLPPPVAERFLHDVERVLIEAAFGDVPWPWLSMTTTPGGANRD